LLNKDERWKTNLQTNEFVNKQRLVFKKAGAKCPYVNVTVSDLKNLGKEEYRKLINLMVADPHKAVRECASAIAIIAIRSELTKTKCFK